MGTIYEMYNSYSSLFRLWIGNFLLIVIYDPEKIKVSKSLLLESKEFTFLISNRILKNRYFHLRLF